MQATPMLNNLRQQPYLLGIALSLTLFFFGAACEAGEENRLVAAAESGNWALVTELLHQDVAIDVAQPDGMTALHWAVYHRHLDSVERLLAAGSDANARTRYDVTPLAIACRFGEPKITAALLEAGAKVDPRLPNQLAPLAIAARTGDPATIQQLLEHSAKVNAKDRKGQTPLMWAAAKGNLAAVDTLLKAGADANAKLDSSFTPLLFAAREGHLPVVKRLVEEGVDVNAPMHPKRGGARVPRKGTSALILAVESGHFELAIWLVDHGADPNDQRSGYTPLHVLSWVRKPNRGEAPDGDPPPRGSGKLTALQFVRAIVKRGADVNTRLRTGKGGRAVLNKQGATPLLMAAKTADLPYLSTLLELGADPNITNVDGATPIMAAAGVGVRAVGEEAGTEPEVLEALQFLIDLGGNVNAVDKNGETAMHGAAYRNFPEVVTFLAEHGADSKVWDHKNRYGWTPTMIAQGHRPGSFKPSPETVAALRQAK